MPPSRLCFLSIGLTTSCFGNNTVREIDRQTLIIDRFRYMLRPMGIEDTKAVLAVNNDFLRRTTTKTRLVPGAIELLEYLRPFLPPVYPVERLPRSTGTRNCATPAWRLISSG